MLVVLALLSIGMAYFGIFEPWKLIAVPQWLGPSVYEYTLHPVFIRLGFASLVSVGGWLFLYWKQRSLVWEMVLLAILVVVDIALVTWLLFQSPPLAMG